MNNNRVRGRSPASFGKVNGADIHLQPVVPCAWENGWAPDNAANILVVSRRLYNQGCWFPVSHFRAYRYHDKRGSRPWVFNVNRHRALDKRWNGDVDTERRHGCCGVNRSEQHGKAHGGSHG